MMRRLTTNGGFVGWVVNARLVLAFVLNIGSIIDSMKGNWIAIINNEAKPTIVQWPLIQSLPLIHFSPMAHV